MSENNQELEGVMRRIQKLLAIAGDDRANPAEAAAAASMAEKVMRKYQLDHADIIASELRSKAPDIGDSAVFANMKRDDPKRPSLTKTPAWGQMLSVAIAQLYDCHVMNGVAKNKFGRYDAAMIFMGYRPDVQVCVWTFDYIVGALIGGVKDWNKAAKARGEVDKVASANYRQGFVSSVIVALQKMRMEKQAEAASAVHGRALMLINTKLAVIEEMYGKPKYAPKKSNARVDYNAYAQGVRDGAKVDLRRNAIGNTPTADNEPVKVDGEIRYKLGR